MTSAAQMESNRANALRSTGPRSSVGKARSSQNAVKHGLTSRLLVALATGPFMDSGPEIQDFVHAMLAELDPETEQERAEAMHVIGCYVRRQRLVELETAALQYGTRVPTLPPEVPGGPPRVVQADLHRAGAEALNSDLFEKLPRYEAHLTREVERGLTRLERLQAARRFKEQAIVGEVLLEPAAPAEGWSQQHGAA